MLVAVAAVAVAGCGDGGGANNDATPKPAADQPASQIATRVAELETAMSEYCERRNSGSTDKVDELRAAAELQALIDLARQRPREPLGRGKRPTVSDALGDVVIDLESDCSDSPLRRRAQRAFDAL